MYELTQALSEILPIAFELDHEYILPLVVENGHQFVDAYLLGLADAPGEFYVAEIQEQAMWVTIKVWYVYVDGQLAGYLLEFTFYT